MIKLKFTPSNIGGFYIMETSDGKQTIIDNSSVSHKGIVWGALPNQFTVTAYALDKNDVKFEYGNKFISKDRVKEMAILFLPIIGGLYRWISSMLQLPNTSAQMMKLLFFSLSLIVGYLIIKGSIFFSRKKVLKRLGGNPAKFQLTFKTNGKRNFIGCVFPLLNVLCFLLFWFIGDGTEVFFLMLNMVFALLACIVSVAAVPVQLYYERNTIDLVSIEEIQ